MKRLFLTLALVLSVLSVMAADIVPISNAFKRGNVSSLSGSMDKEVDIARYKLEDIKEKVELQVTQNSYKVNESTKKLALAEKT